MQHARWRWRACLGRVDVAVVDEIQMVADPSRGHSFTRAILGIPAHTLHVCGDPAAPALAAAAGPRYRYYVLHLWPHSRESCDNLQEKMFSLAVAATWLTRVACFSDALRGCCLLLGFTII